MAERFEIRIFNERYNTHINYYQGNEDIKCKFFTDSFKDLIRGWTVLLRVYEGKTYSVWDNGKCIVGGAFDPSDIDIITTALGKKESVYRFKVSFGEGRYAKGTYDVMAYNIEEAEDKALSSISSVLATYLPALDIEINIVPVD